MAQVLFARNLVHNKVNLLYDLWFSASLICYLGVNMLNRLNETDGALDQREWNARLGWQRNGYGRGDSHGQCGKPRFVLVSILREDGLTFLYLFVQSSAFLELIATSVRKSRYCSCFCKQSKLGGITTRR